MRGFVLLPRSFQSVSIGERHHHMSLSPPARESPEQTPMAPWHHGNMASSLNFAPSLSPHPVHKHRVGATYVSAAGLASIFCSNRLFSSSLRFTLGHVHESKTFRCPTALIRPQCFGHCASNPAYAQPPTTKSYTDKTRIYYYRLCSIALRNGHANRNARPPRSKYSSGI